MRRFIVKNNGLAVSLAAGLLGLIGRYTVRAGNMTAEDFSAF
ncbi:conserved protein of unknown function [Pseudomonas marincola]|uniref:Uncharacterized protein n=1 Tax=Pseudomonas marincola TaxID=437900 RepID=A0A653E174_9PSED|nr:conserved protein of unknown function [Pseudomonas marincola]